MRKKNYETRKGLAFASLILLATVGCGRIYTGNYTGTSTSSNSSVPENVSLLISQPSGNTISGSWTGMYNGGNGAQSGVSSFGQLQGTAGTDSITNAQLNLSMQGSSCTFTGNFIFVGDTAQATLVVQAQPTGSTGFCPVGTSRQVTITKQK